MNLIPRSFFFDDDFDNFFVPTTRKNDMKCDIYEDKDAYHVEMDIPGYNKEDISIEVKDGYLTVKASKKSEDEEETKNYIRKERVYGEMQRSFALADVDTENIDAKFTNGSLHLTLRKQEKQDSTKKIEIK